MQAKNRKKLNILRRKTVVLPYKFTRDFLLSALATFLLALFLARYLLHSASYSTIGNLLLSGIELFTLYFLPAVVMAIIYSEYNSAIWSIKNIRASRLVLSSLSGVMLGILATTANLIFFYIFGGLFSFLYKPQFIPVLDLVKLLADRPGIGLIAIAIKIVFKALFQFVFLSLLLLPLTKRVFKHEFTRLFIAALLLTFYSETPAYWLLSFILFFALAKLSITCKSKLEVLTMLFTALIGREIILPYFLKSNLYKLPLSTTRLNFSDTLPPLLVFLMAMAAFIALWLPLKNTDENYLGNLHLTKLLVDNERKEALLIYAVLLTTVCLCKLFI